MAREPFFVFVALIAQH